jgi:hypothetical protein
LAAAILVHPWFLLERGNRFTLRVGETLSAGDCEPRLALAPEIGIDLEEIFHSED